MVALTLDEEGVRFRLFVAVFQSLCAFVMILGMDFISDMDCTDARYDRAVVMLIEALGVSVGLSWEHAFHECVEVTVEFMSEDKVIFRATNDPKVWSLLLSAIIVLAVLPAYRLYIVPTRCLLLEEYEKAQEEAEEEFRAGDRKTAVILQEGITKNGHQENGQDGREEQTYVFGDDASERQKGKPLKKEERRPLG
jgi:hypothetical protein